ncbi:hypothetical protein VXS02_14520 [Photobacterium piscicola]|uniref:Uncharacterized protein n=1 Tax=Photobacterium piscicola TaxID=1378299 RepID=A0ABU6LGI7_9GAMM|nr:hypothetical protein [Photobacterium piscicola]MEC6882744.1 hypothetical protein [Photobacterium piscicola]MEC6898678.1 hypothetical protein [Photobacterium piscicola]
MRQLSDYQQQIQALVCNSEYSLAQAISQLRLLLEDIENDDAITDTTMHTE